LGTRQDTAAIVAGGSFLEAVLGLGTVVLAIIGLASLGGVLPLWLVPVCAIVLGVAFLSEAAAHMTHRAQMISEFHEGFQAVSAGPTGSEFIAGITGVVLGVLALIFGGTLWGILMSTTLIVFGAGLLLGSAANVGFSSFDFGGGVATDTIRAMARETMAAASGSSLLIGMASIVLGILALVGYAAIELNLVGMLILGLSLLLSGAAFSGKMASILLRR
jgi:hypothetical protein